MKNRIEQLIAITFLALLVNAGYIGAFATASVFYMGNVLLHLVIGTVLAVAFLLLFKKKREMAEGAPTALGFFMVCFAAGIYLTWKGSLFELRWVMWMHVIAGGLGTAAMIPWVWKKSAEAGGGWLQFRRAFQFACIVLVGFPLVMTGYRAAFPDKNAKIVNPLVVPTSMNEEGGGPKSPFFPSSAKTNVGGIIPSNFFMDSETCGECHKQIYEEWKSSVHHFASFNNQYYRKAIEYMQDVKGPQPSKWCAGCHDHAVFFNGRFDKPIKGQIDTPEAHTGLACTSCHAITHVDSSMGQGGFTIEYPPLHELMTSKNKYVKTTVDFMTYLNPEPHRRTFMKPFMNTSEYCASCHKVHLDVPVNDYRWFRGFNDYDNWQASGFGEGARSFYYPPKGQTCAECHMPKVDSREAGHRDGKTHSHRFAAANTAVATSNQDVEQMDATKKFLTSGFITVDIFAASPVDEKSGTRMVRRAATGPQLMSSTAAGEETDQTGETFIREVGKVSAPLNKTNLKLTPGSTSRVDVVVRTRKIGHFFPGGTLDSFDIWLELEGTDETGKVVFMSGAVEEEGKGAVETGAHFYRAFQLDAAGNPINKRNAWQSRSVLYVRQIQPGAADTVHYLLRVPKDAKGAITLKAKLNYRKFSRYYTKFAYAGQPVPGQDPSLLDKHHNSMEYSFDKANIPANVSGKIKGEIPDLPTIVLAKAEAKILLTTNPAETQWTQVAQKGDRERWNDWGIGMLLQGDLRGAEYAFTRVTEAEPGYADGWLNVARALIQEGETEAAKPFLTKSLAVNPALGRTYYFRALVEKADGDYDQALKSLQVTIDKFPRDRVVLNQVGRILFLQRKYKESVEALKRVALVDPEDLQMHYTAMLAYRGMGDTEKAEREQTLFKRFKAEESSQSITAIRRQVSPEDNNERQNIHDHESVPLGAVAKAAGRNSVSIKPGGLKPVEVKVGAAKAVKPKPTSTAGGLE